jgi:hypothetical protein
MTIEYLEFSKDITVREAMERNQAHRHRQGDHLTPSTSSTGPAI